MTATEFAPGPPAQAKRNFDELAERVDFRLEEALMKQACGGWSGSVSAAARDHRRDRPQQDRDVQPDRPVLQVVEVEPDEIVEAEIRAAGNLPEPGHARKDE